MSQFPLVLLHHCTRFQKKISGPLLTSKQLLLSDLVHQNELGTNLQCIKGLSQRHFEMFPLYSP